MAAKQGRDIEKGYSTQKMVAKLRRLADCVEQRKPFQIQIAGERVRVPAHAIFNVRARTGSWDRRGGISVQVGAS